MIPCRGTSSGGSGGGPIGAEGVLPSAVTASGQGLITEVGRGLLRPGQHPVFQNVGYRGGEIRPAPSHPTVTDPGWPFDQLGISDVAQLDSKNDTWAYCPLSGGEITYRDGSGQTGPMTLPAPDGAPQNPTLASSGTGIVNGGSRTYTAVWTASLGGFTTSIGPTVTVNNSTGSTAQVTLDPPANPPTGAGGWRLYALEENTAIWRLVGEADLATGITDANSDANLANLLAYDAPLDPNGDPEVLVQVGNCQAVATHKGCLFAAEGTLIRYSEGVEHHWFRDWCSLDAGDTVQALISWDEVLYAFTPRGVYAVVGNPPYFEIRQIPKTQGPVARLSIVDTEAGVFFLGDKGIYLFRGDRTTPVTVGSNTPWIEQISDPASCVAGAVNDAYALVDPTPQSDGKYRVLRYDWVRNEFREYRISFLPAGFRFDSAGRRLVARAGSTYYAWEGGLDAVSWYFEYRTIGGECIKRLPMCLCVDMEGNATLRLYVDDQELWSTQLSGPGRVRLPRARGRRWYVSLEGSGGQNDTLIRAVKYE